MWLSADIALRDIGDSFALTRARASEGERSPTRARTQESGICSDTAKLARGGQSGARAASEYSKPVVQIEKNLSVLFLWKSGISWHFACSICTSPRAPKATEHVRRGDGRGDL